MALFAMKSLARTGVLEDAASDYKAGFRAEQFRFGEKAVYFPAFPHTQYISYAALSGVKVRNTAISVAGSCGKQIPMVCIRLFYDEGEFYKDFLFEKQKVVDRVLEVIGSHRPDLPVDRENTLTQR